MAKPRKWTLDNLKLEASKYETLRDFRTKSEGAYKAYVKQGKPEEVSSQFEPFRGYWAEESAIKEAEKYDSRWSFQKGNGGAYRFLWKHNLLDKVFGEYSVNSWCETTVRETAKGLRDRKTFKSKYPGAHKFAYDNGLLDELFGYTLNTPNCDNDVVYLWKPKSYKNVYKVGITSKRLGDERIKYVSRKSGLEVDSVVFIYTDDAKRLETDILDSNEPYGFFPSFSGSSEFRVINDIGQYYEEKVN